MISILMRRPPGGRVAGRARPQQVSGAHADAVRVSAPGRRVSRRSSPAVWYDGCTWRSPSVVAVSCPRMVAAIAGGALFLALLSGQIRLQGSADNVRLRHCIAGRLALSGGLSLEPLGKVSG